MGWNLFNFTLMMLVLGCGRLAFEPRTDGASATGATDAPVGACDRAAPYGAPILVAGLSDATDAEATLRLSNDELRGYLWTIRVPGEIDLELATRPTLAAPFSTTPVTELNTSATEFEPTLSADEQVLVFMSGRPGTGGADLYLAQRASAIGPFTLDGQISVNTPSNENQPFLTPTALYFASDRNGDYDIFVVARDGRTTFMFPPQRVDSVSVVGAEETDPVLSADGLSLYFGSDRMIPGDVDLYVATRPIPSGPFGAAIRLPQLSTTSLEGPSWESLDGCRLYLASDSLGSPDVYMASRPQ